jgi:hypothetical protein
MPVEVITTIILALAVWVIFTVYIGSLAASDIFLLILAACLMVFHLVLIFKKFTWKHK